MKPSIIDKFFNEEFLLNIARTHLVDDWGVPDKGLVDKTAAIILDSYKLHLNTTKEHPTLDGYKSFLNTIDVEALIRDIENEDAVKAYETLFSNIASELNSIKQAVESGESADTIIMMIENCLNKINSK